MNAAGFACYEEEAWHFDYGNQFWGKKKGQPAIYSTADFSLECQQHEAMRRQHMAGTINMHENPRIGAGRTDDVWRAAYDAAMTMGGLRTTLHPLAAKI
jgi:hypothetical protein